MKDQKCEYQSEYLVSFACSNMLQICFYLFTPKDYEYLIKWEGWALDQCTWEPKGASNTRVVKSASTIGPGRGVQVIWPISMKLGQFEGVHPKLLHSNFKEIWSKPGGVDHPLVFVFVFF